MAIYPIPESREEWLALRSKYVGASEIAALFGVQANYQKSPFALFHVKRGEVPEVDLSDVERVQAGVYLEPGIAAWACAKMGWQERPGVFAVDDQCPGMSATLDRVILPSQQDIDDGFIGPGALEIKNVDRSQAKLKWVDDEAPAFIILQHQQQLACSGYAWGAIAGLDGGNRLMVTRYHARPRIHAAIRSAVTDFWQRVGEGRQYDADGFDSTTKALRALYPEPDEEAEMDFGVDPEVADLCAKFKEFSAERTALKTEITALGNKLKQKLGNYGKGYVAGPIAFRFKHTVGDDTPERLAKPGEIIKGRKGNDRFTVSAVKADSKQKKAA